MGIVVQKKSEYLAANYPGIYSWFPCKEQASVGAASNSLVDYAQGKDYVETSATVLDKSVSHAINSNAVEYTFSPTDGLGSQFSLAADENLIALCVAANMNDAGSYLAYGRNNFNDTIIFSDGGTAKLVSGGVSYPKTAPNVIGASCFYIGLRRDTNKVEHGSVSATNSVSVLESVDGPIGALDFSQQPGVNGVYLFCDASTGQLYNMVIAKFTGAFPAYADFAVSDLIDWRAASVAGEKYIPSFLYDLTV